MKELWIFGDSYADPSYPQLNTWPKKLERQYKVSNFALKGTGPDWSLDKLKTQIEDTNQSQLKNVNVIFLISDIRRYNLSFLEPRHQVFDFTTRRAGIPNDTLINLKKKYKKYEDFYNQFEKYYITNSSYIDTEVKKIISYLFMQTRYFNKLLVWPIFDDVENFVPDNKTFHVPSKCLRKLTDTGNTIIGEDTLANHLTQEQHDCVFDEFLSYFEYHRPINVKKIKKLLDI